MLLASTNDDNDEYTRENYEKMKSYRKVNIFSVHGDKYQIH